MNSGQQINGKVFHVDETDKVTEVEGCLPKTP